MKLLATFATVTACALLAPSAVAGPSAAHGAAAQDDSSAAKARAELFFKNGIKAYRHHHYKDAIDAFLQAHHVYPSPTLSFNAARAYEKLQDNAGALRFYRAYLRQAPDASDRKLVRRRIEKLEAALHKKGVQQLTIMSDPDGATVVIDDRPVGVTPWTGEIYPGRHHLRLRREGYQDAERDFELPDLRAIDLDATLDRAPATAPSPTAPPPAATHPPLAATHPRRDELPHHGVRLPTWIAFGAGVAALGGAAVFEGLRRGSEGSVKSEPTQVARASAYDQMKSRQTTARILAIAGGAALVVGGVLLYVDLSSGGSEKSARLALGCAPGGCNANLGGRW